MQEVMQVVSVNVGRMETIQHGDKCWDSGICKRPQHGNVRIEATGLDGDTIANQEHHGGPDQAVYAYSLEDYEWWSKTVGRELEPGCFGENLTIRGLPTDPNIGDRLLIGEVVLEVTAPRIPCGTLAGRMRDSGFSYQFRQAARPGAYLRVLNGGTVAAGDNVTLVENVTSEATLLDAFQFYYALSHNVADLERLLQAPLAERFRVKVEDKLAAAIAVE